MNKTYEVITDQIIGLLEKGTVPWRKPWTGGGLPRNINGRPYRGVNVFVLYGQEYSSPCWLTFNQAKKLGGNIKKGEKGIPVVFWKILKRLTDEVDEITGEPVVKQVPFLRYYTVFNLDQTDGIEAEQEMMPLTDTTPIKRTEDILDHMQHPPLVKHEGYRAFYSPIRDEIVLPEQKFFFSTEDYYSTRFHETIHWTGHNSRLNRKGITGFHMFGDKDYSQEELVAEMGAAFLCAEAKISAPVINNQAAYLQGWLKKLRDDKKLVVIAGAQAQKAVDLVLDREVT